MKSKYSNGLKTALLLLAVSFKSFLFGQSALPDSTTAGWATADPGYTYGSNGRDITSGVKYWYLQNDSVIVNISNVDVVNNSVGGMHKGVPMDVMRKNGKRDNIDWAQLIIHPSILSDWNYPSQNVNLDSIWIADNDSSIYSYGASKDLPNIKVRANYSLLPNAPILKIKLKIFNTTSTDFNGYIEYQMDPDEVDHQRGWIPGMGDAPGLVNSGWASNYVYGGTQGAIFSGYPNHGIAWVKDNPVALLGSTIVFGAWFGVDVKAGDSTEIELYHITEVADKNKDSIAQDCIERWAEKLLFIDPDLSKYNRITGVVEDVHGNPVKNMLIRAKNTLSELKGQSLTDETGHYSILVPWDVYTFTVDGLGYLSHSRSINISSAADSVLNFSLAENFAITPIQVWAGNGKQMIASGFVSCNENDIIMENDKIALAISVKNPDPQIGRVSKGNIIDLIAKGDNDDLLDWMILTKMSNTNDSLDGFWQRQDMLMDTVYVVTNNSNEAKVRTEGRMYRPYKAPLASNETLELLGKDSLAYRKDVKVITEYTLNYGHDYVFVHTEIKNNSTTDTIKSNISDVMDFDGTGEVSYLPGIGEITGDFGRSADFEFYPNAPWFAQYGAADLAYGIIYEGAMADSMLAYGIKRWMSNKKQVSIAPNTSFTMDRFVVASSTKGLSTKSDAIADVYSKIKVNQSGVSFEVTNTNNIISANDTVTAYIKIKNRNAVTVNNIQTKITSGYNVQLIGNALQTISLKENDSTVITYKMVGKTGGRAFSNIIFTDQLGNAFERKVSVFVKGKGWYAGDNHTHSKYSDGVGTIAENVEAGYAKGMAFMTSTDHNTLNQKADVDAQNALYDDMIIMTGEEVTTSKGHCLAYNIGALIPWNLNVVTQQQIIDSTNNSSTEYGNGFMYLAHPHYPGLPWLDYTVRNNTGLEVWNGFYHATHSVNSLTFHDWDSLNVLGLHLFGISNSDAHNPAVVAKNYIMAYVEDFTKQEIISTMRDRGTYYGTNGPLMNFLMENTMMGGKVFAPTSGRDISIDVEGNSNSDKLIVEIRLIKNGNIIKTWAPKTTSANYKHTDNGKPGDFYRIEMTCEAEGYAFSNPIWVAQGNVNANLMELSVNSTLVLGFTPSQTNYTKTVQDSSFTITAKPEDATATVTIKRPTNIYSKNAADRTATITVIAQDNITKKEYQIVFEVPAAPGGISDINPNSILIYPVPASDILNVSVENAQDIKGYQIFNMQGVMISEGKLAGNTTAIPLSDCSSGAHVIVFETKGNAKIFKKITIIK